MKHYFKRRRIIVIRIILQESNLADIRQFLFLVTFLSNNVEYARFQFPSIYHIFTRHIGKISLFQTEIGIIRQIIILKYLLLLEKILREQHLRNNPLADLIRRNLIFLKDFPQRFHIARRSAVIISKVHQRDFIILLLFEQFKTQITDELVLFIVIIPDPPAAQPEHVFLVKCIDSFLFQSVKCRMLLFILLFPYPCSRGIFTAQVHKTRFVKKTSCLIHNRIRIMTSLYRLPYHPGFFVIEMDNRSFLPVIGNSLPDLSVFFYHQNTLHIRDLRRDRIRITDIAHRLHPFGRHLFRLAESLIQNTQRFRNMPFHQLIPCKYNHLLPVIQIKITRLLLISNQIRIQERRFLIIQRISMHKIKQDYLRKRASHTLFIYRHHIILVKLRDLKLRFHRLLIPCKVTLLDFISTDKQCADRIQDHRLVIDLIDTLQNPEHLITVLLLLAREIRHIQRQFLGHQPVFRRKIKHLRLKRP